jgi:putative membrane protein insertion efficiency factor
MAFSGRQALAGDAPPAGLSSAPRPGARVLIFLLSLYKAFASPLLPSSCKFYPTCSEYAKEAVSRHGVTRGLNLALRRLLRCRPFSPGGYDPVPDA